MIIDPKDQSFIAGSRRAYLHILTEIIQHLEGEQKEIARYVFVRNETLLKLEEICDALNIDFEETLYIPDMLEKIFDEIEDLKRSKEMNET